MCSGGPLQTVRLDWMADFGAGQGEGGGGVSSVEVDVASLAGDLDIVLVFALHPPERQRVRGFVIADCDLAVLLIEREGLGPSVNRLLFGNLDIEAL